MKIVWSAIVRNEAAIVKRCVNSLLPHIDGAVVVDTGSADGTPELIQQLFDAAGKPVEISSAPFVDFEQARNEALRCARISRMEWDWLLLVDADMQLMVKQKPLLNGETGLAYDMKQVAGGSLSYYNRRLISRHADCWYRGVTHEYCDIASDGVIDRAEFIDHADGANRSGKLQRDIALLEEALKTETREGLIQRYHFYLAGTYYDLGDWPKAAEHYRIRTTLGGFDEEVWYAHMRLALCHKRMEDHPAFLWGMLRTYQLRPHRGEVLQELAKFFRERGDNSASLLFSAPGLQLPYPAADHLFVDDHVSRSLKEEFAICAYYDERHRERGAAVCNELALHGSAQARSNQYWYLRPLVNHVPSFRPTRIELPLPIGWVASNPSLINDAGQPLAVVRSVNYTITPEGMYSVLGADGGRNNGNPICTRNYLVRFSPELTVEESRELALPKDWPDPKFELVRGFEDSRLFKWDDELWTLSCVRELTPEGWCEQVLVTGDIGGHDDWKVIRPAERRHEKNWMPWVAGGDLLFVYRLGTIIDTDGKVVFHEPPDFDVSHISGGSQVIEAEGHWLALVHEARPVPGRPHNRWYQHRFVAFEEDGRLAGISAPFCFNDRGIEFAAGLAYFPKTQRLITSYGVMDREAWLAEMNVSEVLEFIDKGRRP